jgi:hypothetical protein
MTTSTMSSTLSTRHQELTALYELQYVRTGELPKAQDLQQFPGFENLTQVELDRFLNHKPVAEYLVNERDIPLNHAPVLTAKQLDWINAITDPTDQRPLFKKRQELGLKMSEIRAWNNNPFYAKILYERSNKQFGNNRHAVLRSLQLEAMSGNMSAIKLYLEMTGDVAFHQSGANVTLNTTNTTVEARGLLNAVLEILQRHLEPELLMIIVNELEEATTGKPSVRPSISPVPPPNTAQRVQAALEVRARPYTQPSGQVVETSDSDWFS